MHFDQNIILIIVAAVIGISRLVARLAEKAREGSARRKMQAPPAKQTERPIPVSRPKTDEERVREFLEALGQPKGAAPPPKVQPRTDLPPRPVAPVVPPPWDRPFSPVLLRPMAEKARKFLSPSKSTPPEPATPAPASEPAAWLQEEERVAAGKTARASAAEEQAQRALTDTLWKRALRSRDSVRDAVVLREILGPPRAVRARELF